MILEFLVGFGKEEAVFHGKRDDLTAAALSLDQSFEKRAISLSSFPLLAPSQNSPKPHGSSCSPDTFWKGNEMCALEEKGKAGVISRGFSKRCNCGWREFQGSAGDFRGVVPAWWLGKLRHSQAFRKEVGRTLALTSDP